MNFKKKYLFIALILCAFFHQNGFTQIEKKVKGKEKQDVRSRFRTAFEEDAGNTQLPNVPGRERLFSREALEAAINADTYVVGPGDVFQINIWSSLETSFRVHVNPEGKLIIPTIGTLSVDGKTLREVQTMVTKAGAQKYLQSKITANLVALRKFRVHVTGQVMYPGLFEAFAVDRASDIIEKAGGLTNWGSERAIQVRHLDGTVDTVDLYLYKKNGLLETNIFLSGGDVIYVPPIQFSQATVKIEGLLNAPGIYQLTKNETLLEFLLRVDALNKQADLTTAYIERINDTNGVKETIPIYPFLQNQGNGHADFDLKDGDLIMIPSRQEEVYVVGAVQNPGPYVYYPNLHAIDYAGFAGGTEKAANFSKIKVIQHNSKKQLKGMDVIVKPGDTVYVPSRIEFGIREITSVVLTITNVLLTMKALNFL